MEIGLNPKILETELFQFTIQLIRHVQNHLIDSELMILPRISHMFINLLVYHGNHSKVPGIISTMDIVMPPKLPLLISN